MGRVNALRTKDASIIMLCLNFDLYIPTTELTLSNSTILHVNNKLHTHSVSRTEPFITKKLRYM